MTNREFNTNFLQSLAKHGAHLIDQENGNTIELTDAWYDKALEYLIGDKAANAYMYDLYPGFESEERFSLLLWRDGHIDIGSETNILGILASL